MSAAPPLRVLHLTAPAPFGGLETVVANLSAGLTATGVKASVAAVVSPSEASNHPFVQMLESRQVPVTVIAVAPRDYLGEFRAVRRLMTELGTTVIHSHGHRSDLMAAAISRWQKCPSVSTLHGFLSRGRGGRAREWLQLRALRGFGAVVGVSQPIIDRARSAGIGTERLHLIPNAWRPVTAPLDRRAARQRLGLPETAFVVGWVGRLSHEKGADVFLDALAAWRRNDFLAAVVGDGSERPALEERAARRGLSGLVTWLGARADAAEAMRAFDVFVLSSRTEGVPMVLFEAMATEIPIVATAVGGVPSVLGPAEALLVAPESPEDLATALQTAREAESAARRRAAAARDRLVQDFAIEPWVARYAAIYRDLAKGRDAGPG